MTRSNTPTNDPTHDLLKPERQFLEAIFKPRSVAVIGASEKAGSVGRTVLSNLISTPFGGALYPVNPHRDSVLGSKAYANIGAVPEKIDLAVVATPAATVPEIIGECADAGVKGAIIISAGFKEAGAAGAQMEQQILARRGAMRIIGPNCLGIMSPINGLNATFAQGMARPGNVAFISQSGALCASILDWSLQEYLGFSAFISIGSMLDVGWGDLINYFGNDGRTQSIIIYMESIGDARAFISAAREVALTKPIIVIKAGRTAAAAKAAASHTGAMVGNDEVFDAAFRRCGVLRVNSISDLFHMAEVLAKQPRPQGPKLMIITNAGGPGVLAADALINSGGELAQLSAQSIEALNQLLPPHWSHNNPIDILGDADADRYAGAIEIAKKDPNCDGLLVALAPQGMIDPTQIAERLKALKIPGKPVLASWMGSAAVAAGAMILNRANIPNFSYPDTAARHFNYMWRYSYNLRGLYETPALLAASDDGSYDRAGAAEIIQTARAAGRELLTEFESKKLLTAYGIPTVATRIADNEEAAALLADEIGYPVALKLHSQTIAHKSDVGGVKLNILDVQSARKAFREIQNSVTERAGAQHFLGVSIQPMIESDGYEIIIGSSLDAQFGPVLLFGAGGRLVEVFQDRALALPPLNATLALRMMEQTRIFTALKGIRGSQPIDIAALEQLLIRFSHLVVEQRWIKEIDINPLLASPDRLIALDARAVLHDGAMSEDRLPKLAIRPYPIQYIRQWQMKDGEMATIRPIRPEDEPLMIKFHESLSERSVYFRYFQMMNLSHRVKHERLTRICFNDYDREIAIVVDRKDAHTGAHEILAVGRLIRLPDANDAEFALLIQDKYQRSGLGTELLRQLVEIGSKEGYSRIVAEILPENRAMQRVSEKLGFRLHYEDGVVKGAIDLKK